ncbi:hypothetical protein AAEY27_01035 [Kosakonia sp. BYX6]|uniref:Uncharacterized protein n=1 Tax=Kosakonia calanthes TaxID=3139408 RepID=A0ABZ3B588_9ENTR
MVGLSVRGLRRVALRLPGLRQREFAGYVFAWPVGSRLRRVALRLPGLRQREFAG